MIGCVSLRLILSGDSANRQYVGPWCSGYHYCLTSFNNKAWTKGQLNFKSCSRCVGDSRLWGTMTMVLAGNKAKRLSSVNHTVKVHHLHHHHHYHHHHHHHHHHIVDTDLRIEILFKKNRLEHKIEAFILK